MRFPTAIAATMATASAVVLPRADYGSWNVSISSTGGSDRARTETVTGVFSHPELTDNIQVSCHYQGLLNGEFVDKTTCEPESFSYELAVGDYDDGYQYKLTLSETVDLAGTATTVHGTSDNFKRTCDTVTGKSCSASNIYIDVSTAAA